MCLRIFKNGIKFFFIFFIPISIQSQETTRVGSQFVMADGGLVLRETGHPEGKKILVIPKYAKVHLLPELGENRTISCI